jgi:DNA-binding XRE family transcriptional regulator
MYCKVTQYKTLNILSINGGENLNLTTQKSMLEIICEATTGQKIAMLRILNKLTQKELAEKADVSKMTVYSWENGIRNPNSKNLRDISRVLGVKEEDLM